MGRTKSLFLGMLAGLALLGGIATPGTGAQAQTLAALPSPSLPSPSLPPMSVSATVLGAARPIVAWVSFCQRYPAECAVAPEEPARIALTPATWNLVVSVNRKVNTGLRAATDMDHWGVADRWDLAEDGIGDCEDFQLLKRKRLAEAGLSRRAMRMTVVIDEKGEGHAVLTLLTDRGEFILDNKTSEILPWYRTGYVFIKRESQDAVAWVSLGGVTSPVTTANR